jgi:hypothetical protein
MAGKVHDIHERAHHAKADPSLVRLTFTMVLPPVLVAAISLLGHCAHTRTAAAQLGNKSAGPFSGQNRGGLRRDLRRFLSVAPTQSPQLAV